MLDKEPGYYYKTVYCDEEDFIFAWEVLTILVLRLIRELPDIMNNM